MSGGKPGEDRKTLDRLCCSETVEGGGQVGEMDEVAALT